MLWRFAHLSDDKTVVKMGHPGWVAGLEREAGFSASVEMRSWEEVEMVVE
jgi:hypothetical protein